MALAKNNAERKIDKKKIISRISQSKFTLDPLKRKMLFESAAASIAAAAGKSKD